MRASIPPGDSAIIDALEDESPDLEADASPSLTLPDDELSLPPQYVITPDRAQLPRHQRLLLEQVERLGRPTFAQIRRVLHDPDLRGTVQALVRAGYCTFDDRWETVAAAHLAERRQLRPVLAGDCVRRAQESCGDCYGFGYVLGTTWRILCRCVKRQGMVALDGQWFWSV